MKAAANLLEADVPVRVAHLLFVGRFDDNAFTAPGAYGIATVATPMEGRIPRLTMTQEFTHVVEGVQAEPSFGWERSIARKIYTDGQAVYITEA